MSQIVLAIECATGPLSVALYDGTGFLASYVSEKEQAKAEELTRAVEGALKTAAVQFHEVERVAVSNGPGSYTGIRAGIAFSQGLCATGNTKIDIVSLSRSFGVGKVDAGEFISLVKCGREELAIEVFRNWESIELVTTGYHVASYRIEDLTTKHSLTTIVSDRRIPTNLVPASVVPVKTDRPFAEYIAVASSRGLGNGEVGAYLKPRSR